MDKNKRNRWLIIGLAALLAVLIGIAWYKSRFKPKGEAITVEKATKRTISETVGASGRVFPEMEVKISSDVSGEIVELYVEEGDSVVVGQILAKIRPDEYQSALERGEAALNSAKSQKEISSSNVGSNSAQLEQLRAEIDRAKSQLKLARNTHTRNETLHKEGIIAQSDYENSETNLRAAEASVRTAEASLQSATATLTSAETNIKVAGYGIASAEASVKELKTSLQKTIIRAPMSGIVSKLNVEKGERVVGTLQMSGTELMRIAKMDKMEVQVEVSESDILKLERGNRADVEVDAYLNRVFKGVVSEISNTANNVSSATGASLNTDQVTNFTVKIRLDPNSYQDFIGVGKKYPFRPGMSASVDIFAKTVENALTVPIISVTARDPNLKKEENDADIPKTDGKLKTKILEELVFVMEGDTVREAKVKIGIQDNDYIEIISGLKEGDMVVSGPYAAITRTLENGKQVHLKNDEEGMENK